MDDPVDPASSSPVRKAHEEGFEPAILWIAGALAAGSLLMLAGTFIPGFGPLAAGFMVGLCAAAVLAIRALVALGQGAMLSCALAATLLVAGGSVFMLVAGRALQEALKPTPRRPIPPDLALDLPARLPSIPDEDDPFRAALLAALDRPAGPNATFVASSPALTELARENPELLGRYLDASAAWRVFEKNGHRYATRRWRTFTGWRRIQDGHHLVRPGGGQRAVSVPWHFAVTIFLDGIVPWKQRQEAVRLTEGPEPRDLPVGKRGHLDYSFLEIQCGSVLLEIAEESLGRERRMTRAALDELEKEFRALRNHGVLPWLSFRPIPRASLRRRWSYLFPETGVARPNPTLSALGLIPANPGESG